MKYGDKIIVIDNGQELERILIAIDEDNSAIVRLPCNCRGLKLKSFTSYVYKEWKEIKKPDFVNSLGEEFYYGDLVHYVSLPSLGLGELTIISEHPPLTGNKHCTEVMTKESALKYIEARKIKPVKGGIYTGTHKNEYFIVRFKDNFDVFSISDKVGISINEVLSRKIKINLKKATPQQERELFLKELKAGWFWDVRTGKFIELMTGIVLNIDNEYMIRFKQIDNNVLISNDRGESMPININEIASIEVANESEVNEYIRFEIESGYDYKNQHKIKELAADKLRIEKEIEKLNK